MAFSARIHRTRRKPAILTTRMNVGSGAKVLHVGRACESATQVGAVGLLRLLGWKGEGEGGEQQHEERRDLGLLFFFFFPFS